MIIKINCENDFLMDVLQKNPEEDMGLYLTPLKKGHVAGNVINKHNYEIVFQDSKDSFISEGNNQIDYQSYCAPLAALHVCNELFAHILLSRDDFAQKEISKLQCTQSEIDNKPCCIEIVSLYIDSKWFRDGRFLLSKYFDGIEVEQQTNRIFRLRVTAPSIFDAVNLLSLVSLFTHITNEQNDPTYMDESLAQKYGRVLSNIRNVPYFVFYLFIQRAMKTEAQFNDLKPVFENYLAESGLHVDLNWLGAKQQRINYISEQLEAEIPILDIGCGEFDFYKNMVKSGFKEMYYAVDKDERIETLSRSIIKRNEENNLVFFSSLEQFLFADKINVLLVEVIEHNSLDDAKALIKQILARYNINKMFISSPNIEFNCYYNNVDNRFRHDDHMFELDTIEFRAVVEECISEQSCSVEYFYLGDCINGIYPTQGCLISFLR